MFDRGVGTRALCCVFTTIGLVACANEPKSASRDSVAVVDSGHVAIDGGTLYFEAAGSGAPVILIHGGNLDRRMWDDQFALLQKQFRVIRYDARGYGRSSPADEPFAAHDDLAALFRELRLTRASLVGLSLGGRIAMDFALAHPEMVDRLVLAAPGISGGKWAQDGDTLWIAEAIAAGRRGDSVGVALAWLKSAYIASALKPPAQAERLRQISVDNARYWMGIVRHRDVEREATPPAAGRLRELKAPILLLVGGGDTPFIMDVARAIIAEAPNVRRVDLPGIGHMINLEAPERFNAEVLLFLAKAEPHDSVQIARPR